MSYDPLTLRINQQIEDERDRLRLRVTELEDENRRLQVGVENLLAFNRLLSDELATAKRNEKAREAAERAAA